ncbi:hypothetical protein D3C73_1064510 [compost metagenome]
MAAAHPHFHFAPDRQHDEPADFHHEQEDAQDLEEVVIDQQRDGQEQEEAIDPGGIGKDDEQRARRAVGGFGLLVAIAEEPFAHPPARHGKRAVLQAGNADQVAKEVVTVKPHQRVQVDRQAKHPAGGGQRKDHIAPGAVGQEHPGQRRQHRHQQFHRHAGAVDQDALTLGQAPGVGRVGVQDGRHHHERHAHGGDARAQVHGGIAMAQFVQRFHQGQAETEGDQARGRDHVGEGAQERVPLA